MGSHELSEHLHEKWMPRGYAKQWLELTAMADDDLLTDLLNAMEGSNDYLKDVIAIASCEGADDRDYIYGVGGHVTKETQRYIRFVIAVGEAAIRIKSAQYGNDVKLKDVLTSLRHAYAVVDGSLESGNPDFAKAVLLTHAATGALSIDHVHDEVRYLAEHYDALEPYLGFIIDSRDISHSQLNMLLTTKPLVPLLGGLL